MYEVADIENDKSQSTSSPLWIHGYAASGNIDFLYDSIVPQRVDSEDSQLTCKSLSTYKSLSKNSEYMKRSRTSTES